MSNQQRQSLPLARLTGRIVEWKGSFGWIQADAPIDHPASNKYRGRLYLGHEDVEAEIEGVGAPVSFAVYFDGSSLGAQNCRPHKGPPVQKAIQKNNSSQAQKGGKAGNGASWGSNAQNGGNANGWGKGSGGDDAGTWGGKGPGCGDAGSWGGKGPGAGDAGGWGGKGGKVGGDAAGWGGKASGAGNTWGKGSGAGDMGWGKGAGSGDMNGWGKGAAAGDMSGWGKASGKGDTNGWGKGMGNGDINGWSKGSASGGNANSWAKGQGAGDSSGWTKGSSTSDASGNKAGSSSTPAATKHKLPRERITQVKTTGDVISFTPNGYGWIEPHVPLDHPEAKKRNGRLFVGKADVKNVTSMLQKGQLVQFHIYSDESGLGAEECEPF